MAITVTHPLDPLTADGSRPPSRSCASRRTSATSASSTSRWRSRRSPRSPAGARRGAATAGGAAILLDPAAGRALEARVDVDAGGLAGLRVVPDMQPAIHPEEFVAGGEAVRRDPTYQAALARRGLAPDEVHIEPWSCGDLEPDDRRVARAISWRRDGGPNPYAHPIGGLVAVVDLNRMEVVRVDDHGIVPIPAESGDYRSPEGGFREQAPIRITQPDGVSFSLDGNEVTWQRWRFRLGLHGARGARAARRRLPRRRRVAAGLPPRVDRRARHPVRRPGADDALQERVRRRRVRHGGDGERPRARLRLPGRDPLPRRRPRQLDGEPTRMANAICLHEEDAGILWKHVDDDGGVEVRRARRFVASCICTVGNYEYGYYWYLGQDGSLAFEVKLTGILHTTAVQPGTAGPHSTEVAPGRRGAVPPALPVRAARHGRRRHGQPRRRGRVGARPARPGQPARHVVPHAPHRARAARAARSAT